MYCQNCGSDNPDGAAFCQSCGAKMPESAPQVAPIAPATTPRARPASPSATVSLGPLRLPESFVQFSQYLLPAGAAFMFLGSFLPWISVLFVSASGFSAVASRLGILTMLFSLALGGGYAALLIMPKEQTTQRDVRLGAVLGLGAMLLVVCIFAIVIGHRAHNAFASVGFGFHLTWLGTLMACAGALWVWLRE